MGGVLLVGGLIGAALGIVLFNYLKGLGQIVCWSSCFMWCFWASSVR